MRIVFISPQTQKTPVSGLVKKRFGKIKITLAAILLAVFSIAVGGIFEKQRTVTTFSASKNTLYAFSYANLSTVEDFDALERDIDFLKQSGFEFILPQGKSTSAGVVLMFERCQNTARLASLLSRHKICAVLLAEPDFDEANKTAAELAFREKRLVPAARIGRIETEAGLAETIGSAKVDFYMRFGENCRIFVHSCNTLICTECFSSSSLLNDDEIIVFIYGNGKNDLSRLENGGGVTVLSRIVKLPEWSLEEYFKSIAP